MATPKPGEIRCPTCHRSTPPAAFCTQCGSAIPADARARPRGMDRDELQERIRARRSGGEPFRRGVGADAPAGYERFQPDPDDARARRAARPGEQRHDHFREAPAPPPPVTGPVDPADAADAPHGRRPDLTREPDDWAAPPPAREQPPAREPEPMEPVAASYGDPRYASAPDEPRRYDELDDEGYVPADDYEYEAWEDGRERRSSGAGAFAILGFMALGVLALLGGAVLAGVFGNGDGTGNGVGQASPSASVAASEAPVATSEPSEAPSISPSTDASAAPAESGEPVVFPDGFVAAAQPCIPGSGSRPEGCNSNGAVNNGQVEIWVGFENGTSNDVVGADLIAPDGSTIAGQSIDLADIGCTRQCDGYTYFNFANLEPGTYQVRVTRNGEFASSISFEVT